MTAKKRQKTEPVPRFYLLSHFCKSHKIYQANCIQSPSAVIRHTDYLKSHPLQSCCIFPPLPVSAFMELMLAEELIVGNTPSLMGRHERPALGLVEMRSAEGLHWIQIKNYKLQRFKLTSWCLTLLFRKAQSFLWSQDHRQPGSDL